MKKKKIWWQNWYLGRFQISTHIKNNQIIPEKMDKLITIKLFFWGVNYEFK